MWTVFASAAAIMITCCLLSRLGIAVCDTVRSVGVCSARCA